MEKLRVFELFAGVGAYRKALKNAKIKCEFVGISEWDINAIICYDNIHNGNLNDKKIDIILRENGITNDKEISNYVAKYYFSVSGKNECKYMKAVPLKKLKRLVAANIRTKNYGSVEQLSFNCPSCDLLTYSFPCQDLSIASMGKATGMAKGSGTRSGLLWEVESLLNIYNSKNILPKYLLLENVKNMVGEKFKPEYELWLEALEKKGYETITFELAAWQCGVPQKRNRIFALSFLKNGIKKEDILKIKSNFETSIEKIKKLYSNFDPQYFKGRLLTEYLNIYDDKNQEELFDCKVPITPSRLKMIDKSPYLYNLKSFDDYMAPTITTKQDRYPNAGFIKEAFGYRFLTPRETFRLMGFTDGDFDRIKNDKECPSKEVLWRLAGNSVVVNVLETIFNIMEKIF